MTPEEVAAILAGATELLEQVIAIFKGVSSGGLTPAQAEAKIAAAKAQLTSDEAAADATLASRFSTT